MAGPGSAWRPRLSRPDVTAIRPWLGTTWEANRAFTTATVAILLGVLALATSAGAFGVAEAAAGLPPAIAEPGEQVAPAGPGQQPGPVDPGEQSGPGQSVEP